MNVDKIIHKLKTGGKLGKKSMVFLMSECTDILAALEKSIMCDKQTAALKKLVLKHVNTKFVIKTDDIRQFYAVLNEQGAIEYFIKTRQGAVMSGRLEIMEFKYHELK